MASSRGNALAFYAAVWLIVLILGSGSLMALRQWGWSRIEAENVEAKFAQVQETFEAGEIIQAQKELLRILDGQPQRIPAAIKTFDTDLLAMPLALESISAAVRTDEDSQTDSARWVMIAEGANVQFDSRASDNRDAALWHARILLERGEFGDAIERFDAYWAGHSNDRRETARQLMPSKADLPQQAATAADELFRFGLWDKAAEVAEAGLAAGAADPGLAFYLAVRAERDEGRLAAIERYKAVLDQLPNHALSIKRVLTLREQNW